RGAGRLVVPERPRPGLGHLLPGARLDPLPPLPRLRAGPLEPWPGPAPRHRPGPAVPGRPLADRRAGRVGDGLAAERARDRLAPAAGLLRARPGRRFLEPGGA